MYISKLEIKGYKTFNEDFNINLNEGLTVLVGENGSGKTTIIDAIRLILNEDEYGRLGISSNDFHHSFAKPAKENRVSSIEIRATFSELKANEQVAYLPWIDATNCNKAYLNLKIDNKETPRGRYNRVVWGGESISGVFEWELIDTLACIYLPPLRDAGSKLDAYRGSRLSRLFRNEKPQKGEANHPLEEKVNAFNDDLAQDPTISDANDQIKDYLKKSLGSFLGQDAIIQFSETSFDRIVEKLRLLFYPKIGTTDKNLFREVSENSLGYNNILYLATVLAELDRTKDCFLKVLLIEEPEAHLHPQLQLRLMQYLKLQANASNIQIIVTTHSATITAATDLESINVLTCQNGANPKSTLLKDCQIENDTRFFLERWLDITKSTLFFAKGLIFVEGIAEALVLKELAKRVMKEINSADAGQPTSLEDCGVSIINLNGIYFRHFFQLFQGYKLDKGGKREDVGFIPIRCAGITDCDPQPVDLTIPTSTDPCKCGNSQSTKYKEELNTNEAKFCKIFTNLKTFEYDLGLEKNNLRTFYQIKLDGLKNNTPNKRAVQRKTKIDWENVKKTNKTKSCLSFLQDDIEFKGEFAQKLAQKLNDEPDLDFAVPQYIKDAIYWAINHKPIKPINQ